MAKAPLHIVYDGDCPFCSSYVALLRLREQYDVHLVDARRQPAVAARYGLDLNEGMIVELEGTVHHGARAIRPRSTIAPAGRCGACRTCGGSRNTSPSLIGTS